MALAILCQLNHVTQRRRLQVQAQHLASETTACTEVTSPLSEVQINWSHNLGDQAPYVSHAT